MFVNVKATGSVYLLRMCLNFIFLIISAVNDFNILCILFRVYPYILINMSTFTSIFGIDVVCSAFSLVKASQQQEPVSLMPAGL